MYSSRPVADSASAIPSLIDKILRVTRPRNCLDGISGAMLCGESRFVQVIEGDREVVHNTFARIGRDPRHKDIETIIDKDIPCRYFSEWAMAYLGDQLGLLDLYPYSNLNAIGRRMSGNDLIDYMTRIARNQLDDDYMGHAMPDVATSIGRYKPDYEPTFPRFHSLAL
jgi:hypothetical protein